MKKYHKYIFFITYLLVIFLYIVLFNHILLHDNLFLFAELQNDFLLQEKSNYGTNISLRNSDNNSNNNNSSIANYLENLKYSSKPKITWMVWEKYRNHFNSYAEFKNSLDFSNFKIKDFIIQDVKSGMDKLSYKKRLIKKTLSRIFYHNR